MIGSKKKGKNQIKIKEYGTVIPVSCLTGVFLLTPASIGSLASVSSLGRLVYTTTRAVLHDDDNVARLAKDLPHAKTLHARFYSSTFPIGMKRLVSLWPTIDENDSRRAGERERKTSLRVLGLVIFSIDPVARGYHYKGPTGYP